MERRLARLAGVARAGSVEQRRKVHERHRAAGSRSILFCDISALVKLYLHEDASDTTRALAAASDVLAVCRSSWVEFTSVLARRQRERPQDAQEIASALKHFQADWPNCLCLEVTQELAQLAGDYADTFALRAYAAVQLAAAELARREMPGELRFACFDARLAKAARVLGMDAG